MRQRVTVKEVLDDGSAVIILRRTSACSADCSQCNGCSSESQIITANAVNCIGAKKGDSVEVESETKVVLWVIAVVYLVPLLLFFAAYFIGMYLPGKAVLWGAIGFVLGVGAAILYNRRMMRTATMSYRIVSVLDN